ncbi:Uncharacterized protein AXF42_Ash010546 [Apostasia shenzhenica]|uniref:Hydroxyproline-rich glycoprotein family protein n=1 Tax=Apostasia shenzhenica TaxID=1088818 RepID=A0A2I0A6D3_9ASPA|nr:Uncharacterized protein AXF42_Ash010546 [Apostasia shenzhenica]
MMEMMAGNGGGGSIRAVAAAAGSVEARFPTPERRSRWSGCFGRFSCFGSQKGVKRIVPATRILDGNSYRNRGNVPHLAGPSTQNTNLNLSLLAPPSSPASFTNSLLPSTVQSPSCFLSMSANSPGGPSSTMFSTGPYAHETQLVSPPVFSTYTTEPSTAPLTPPPELAHFTTPSSPDVPFAQLLSSSLKLKRGGKENGVGYSSFVPCDFQNNYPLYPGSPMSSLISPASGTPRTGLSSPHPERDIITPELANSRNSASNLAVVRTSDSDFFSPDTSQLLYSSYPHSGARLSVSSKTCKQDPEEIEAYRASFGFSADEIATTQNYVEINDGLDVSFSMSPFCNSKPWLEQHPFIGMSIGGQKSTMLKPGSQNMSNYGERGPNVAADNEDPLAGADKPVSQSEGLLFSNASLNHSTEKNSEQASFSKSKSKRVRLSDSCSDAEIEYRRARSLKDVKNVLSLGSSPA